MTDSFREEAAMVEPNRSGPDGPAARTPLSLLEQLRANDPAAWAQLQDVADPLAEPVAGEDAEMSAVYRRALEQVRGEFPEHVWQAFWLTTIEGRAPAALADELDMTVNHIRQAKSRVLRRM